MYLVTSSWINNLRGRPIYFIIADLPFNASLFTLTMITDALNLSQTSKMLMTAYTLATFAYSMLYSHQAAFYQTDVYNEANFTIPNYFGFDSLHINIVDVGYQSAQILAIFSAKQIFAVVKNPKKASIIKKNPFLIYEDREDAVLSVKNVRMWKIICIGIWIITFLVYCLLFATYKGKVLLIIVHILIFIIVCLQISGSIKALYTANIIILIIIFLYGIGCYLFEWDGIFVTGMCLEFGLCAIYTLKIKQLNKDETQPVPSNESNDESTEQEAIKPSKDVKCKEIKMNNVQYANQWDNIDRQQSIKL